MISNSFNSLDKFLSMKLNKGTKLLTLVLIRKKKVGGSVFNISDFSRNFSCSHHLRGNAHALNIPRITWYSKQKDHRRLTFKTIRIYVE